jgi:DNA adenine methylase
VDTPPTPVAPPAKVAPLLRWAGSKRKLLPHLLPYWEQVRTRYVEPFVGSGALFFSANPEDAVLADLNGELIHTYRAVRDEPERVARHLLSLRRGRKTYLRLRSQDPLQLPACRRAARFIYLNRYCFNGLYRTNLEGRFNVPYAPTRSGPLPGEAQLTVIAERLQRATLMHADFERAVARAAQPGDFIYLDPPFAVANRRLFRQYNRMTFGFDDLHRLLNVLHCLDRLGTYFVLSYAVCTESLLAFRPWRVRRLLTQRNIAGFVAHRRRAAELLVTNIC